jgi:hypothetical protein
LLDSFMAQTEASKRQPEPIKSMTLPTRNRPGYLKRCLESYLESARKHGRDIRVVVADSSDEPGMADANQDVLQSLKKQFGNAALYINKESLRVYADQLAECSGVSSEIAEFAVLNPEQCPVNTGANRNALLLATIGESIAQVDDDTVCSIAACHEMREGIRLTSVTSAAKLWFFEDKPPVEPDDSLDFFALHEQMLGSSLPEQVNQISPELVHMHEVTPGFFHAASGGCNRILVTSMGLVGDHGGANPLAFLTLAGNTRAALMRTEETYSESMANHLVVRSVQSPAIGDCMHFSGAKLGLDNREMLPPFMPVMRGQDSIFCTVISRTRSGYFGFLPYMVLHDRPQRFPQDLRKHASGIRNYSVIVELIESFKCMRHNPEENQFALGKHLEDLAQLPLSDFESVTKQAARFMAIQQIQRLEPLLAKYGGSPSYWARDLEEYISTKRASVSSRYYHVGSDLVEAFGGEHARALQQRLVLRYGQLLKAWPQLRSAAQELRNKGFLPGMSI